MRVVLLDGAHMTDREEVHRLFAQALEFPSWYGNNLDGLYDLLCEQSDLSLHLTHCHALTGLGDYGQALLDTLRDAAAENPRLTLRLSD